MIKPKYVTERHLHMGQLLSTVLKRFCPWHSNKVFVLVLAHLEPELEVFEVNNIGDDGDEDL